MEAVYSTRERIEEAVCQTAPGTALRMALDMIIAGNLGALICIGDVDAVLASGTDGFPLDISFTANRLFELSKMDGAIVIDKDITQILRANFHLQPDSSLSTSETGMRHRTAARMSLFTSATVISISARRRAINIYVDGERITMPPVDEVMTLASQLLVTMQTSRQSLDRRLLRLTTLELDNHVTLGDISSIFSLFEVLFAANRELEACVSRLGTQGTTVEMQRFELLADLESDYLLMIRDYAKDSSEESAQQIRAKLSELGANQLRSASTVGKILGYEDARDEDRLMQPLGLRTLSSVSVVTEGMADKIVEEYGSLRALVQELKDDSTRLDNLGLSHPSILVDALWRLWGK